MRPWNKSKNRQLARYIFAHCISMAPSLTSTGWLAVQSPLAKLLHWLSSTQKEHLGNKAVLDTTWEPYTSIWISEAIATTGVSWHLPVVYVIPEYFFSDVPSYTTFGPYGYFAVSVKVSFRLQASFNWTFLRLNTLDYKESPSLLKNSNHLMQAHFLNCQKCKIRMSFLCRENFLFIVNK